MSWECKYLRETFCARRNQECNPGATGCVLQGRFIFPLRENATEKKAKRSLSGSVPCEKTSKDADT